MWNDPIVDEVRKARAEIAKKSNYNFDKLFKMLKIDEAKSKKLGWKVVSLKNKQKINSS